VHGKYLLHSNNLVLKMYAVLNFKKGFIILKNTNYCYTTHKLHYYNVRLEKLKKKKNQING